MVVVEAIGDITMQVTKLLGIRFIQNYSNRQQ
jgi:hypothetical protein